MLADQPSSSKASSLSAESTPGSSSFRMPKTPDRVLRRWLATEIGGLVSGTRKWDFFYQSFVSDATAFQLKTWTDLGRTGLPFVPLFTGAARIWSTWRKSRKQQPKRTSKRLSCWPINIWAFGLFWTLKICSVTVQTSDLLSLTYPSS